MKIEPLVSELRAGRSPDACLVLKQSPVRCVARAGDVVIKVALRRPKSLVREARVLARARALGIAVPELVGAGPDWIATRFVSGRPAVRADVPELLAAVSHMHAAGMLHRDLHRENVLVGPDGTTFLDVQKARFLPFVPDWLRRRELGYLAFSFGSPLPDAFEPVRFWRDRRAQTHWRSRTKRCLRESSGFTPISVSGVPGFRRREVDPAAIARAIEATAGTPPLKDDARAKLYRVDPWVLKRFSRPADAKSAWVSGHGLEVRGISTGRALAWCGHWLVMQDAGPTLHDWIERDFARAAPETQAEMADRLGTLLARLHARGIYHPDLKANNVAWSPGADPRLLDYAGVRFARRVSHARRIKNLAQLNAAIPDVVPGALRKRALERYFEGSRDLGRTDATHAREALRRDVVELSLARRHRWSGC